jgi:hypothetical protein
MRRGARLGVDASLRLAAERRRGGSRPRRIGVERMGAGRPEDRASGGEARPWAAFPQGMGDKGGKAIEGRHERAHARGGKRSQPRANAIGQPRRGAGKKKDRRANVDPLPFVMCGDLVAVRV